MLNFKRFLFAFFCCIFLILPAQASEFIEAFNSDITVNQDGSMTIVETITVHHEGQAIRRGIYRDLSSQKGEQYKVLEVKRNNFPEPWFIERNDTFLRLNTGDDELLPHPATSVFELTYVVYDALRPIRGENLNELYWNVTGKWAFPIDKVTVRVHYPENTDVVRQYVYKTAHDAKMLPKSDFFDLGNLPTDFEVTIAQAFTQGTVNIPFPRLYKTLIYALMATLIYFLIMWWYCGKDPKSQPIVPDWEPPQNLTPLECAVLNHQGKIPSNAFFIHIVWLLKKKIISMATQKYSCLFGSDEVYELTTLANISEDDKKNGEIKSYLDNFPNMLRLVKKPSEKITSYQQKLAESVQNKLDKKYYNRHGWVTFFGALIFPSVWMWLFPESIGLMFWCLMWGAGIISLFVQRRWLVAIPFIAVLIPVMGMLIGFDLFNAMLFALYAVMIYAFYYLMFEPTFIGQREIEKIAGLKMFLEAVTGNSASQQPDKRVTPQDMEDLFPYAVALGLEKAWSKKYESVFGEQALAEVQKSHLYYMPQIRANLGNYCTTAASYTPPSSSSSGIGSSGGGHAGGGFGGGGGGGR